jgi:hypothetical protein
VPSMRVIKVNNNFTLKDVAHVNKLGYNLLFVSRLVDADLDVLFHKAGSKVLDSCGDLVCGSSRIGKVFEAAFSFAQSSMKCLIIGPRLSSGSGIGDLVT